jgi:hypothetical protein
MTRAPAYAALPPLCRFPRTQPPFITTSHITILRAYSGKSSKTAILILHGSPVKHLQGQLDSR